MRAPVAVAFALAMAACKREGGDGNGDYPAVLNDAEETEECANLQVSGCPFGAATSYFAGVYEFDGSDVSGHEYWYWIPNDVLADQSDDWEPNTPCLLVWEFFGAKNDEPEDCSACLYQLTGDATFQPDDSDCDSDLENSPLVQDTVPWTDIVYNVREGDGNGVAMYYPSGTEFGAGTDSAGGLEWLGIPECQTVGATEEGCTPQ